MEKKRMKKEEEEEEEEEENGIYLQVVEFSLSPRVPPFPIYTEESTLTFFSVLFHFK